MEKITFKRKTVSAIIASGLAVSCFGVPALAYAADADEIPSTAQTTTAYVTGAATRAAMPAVEILGLASVEEGGQFVTIPGYYDWAQPKYWLAASGYNTVLSPYLANLATGLTGSNAQAAIFNAARAGGGAGPDGALAAYGSDSTDDAVWNLLPAVIVGDGSDVDYDATGYKPNVAGYNPIGVDYGFTDYSGLVDTMNTIAAQADAADTADTSKTLRYGSAATIAQDYAKYIYGTQGYILKAIDNEQVNMKTVALVTNAVSNGDGTYTYTLLSYADSGAIGDGTASQNRYLETVQNVAYNYADENGVTTATTAQLAASGVDLVMVGGQQSSANYSAIETALQTDGLLSKSYLVQNNGSQGAMYGVVMNSVENAQNIGRILGCLYPNQIDQDDFVAYYYDVFYHINSGDLAHVMDSALDGVRNWDATGSSASDLTSWTTADASTYSKTAVQAKINEGYAYLGL